MFWKKDVCLPFIFPAPFVLLQTRMKPFIYGVPGLNVELAWRDFMFLHRACACKHAIPVVSSKSSQCMSHFMFEWTLRSDILFKTYIFGQR